MRISQALVPMALLAAAAGCSSNAGGFLAQGNIDVTLSDQTSTGFPGLATQVRIDPTLPSGQAVGFTGSCAVGPNGRSVQIVAVGSSNQLGLNSIDITMPAWSQDTCTSCTHGTLTAVVGTSQYTGTETRVANGAATGGCTFNATEVGSLGMQLSVSCSGLTTNGDTRTANVAVGLNLENCASQDTGAH